MTPYCAHFTAKLLIRYTYQKVLHVLFIRSTLLHALGHSSIVFNSGPILSSFCHFVVMSIFFPLYCHIQTSNVYVFYQLSYEAHLLLTRFNQSNVSEIFITVRKSCLHPVWYVPIMKLSSSLPKLLIRYMDGTSWQVFVTQITNIAYFYWYWHIC